MATNAAMTVITTTVRTIGRRGLSPDTEPLSTRDACGSHPRIRRSSSLRGRAVNGVAS
jgi:hypothetical protein